MIFQRGKPTDRFMESTAAVAATSHKPGQGDWRTLTWVGLGMSAITSLARIASAIERMEDKP